MTSHSKAIRKIKVKSLEHTPRKGETNFIRGISHGKRGNRAHLIGLKEGSSNIKR